MMESVIDSTEYTVDVIVNDVSNLLEDDENDISDEKENNSINASEIDVGLSSHSENSTETVVYVVTSSEESSNQSVDVVTYLVVIILVIGVVSGNMLGRILWGRIR